MLSKRINGLFAEPRWLVVLCLSACLSVTTGCGGESKSSTDDPSTADDVEDDASDEDDSTSDDDDDSPSGMKDAGPDSGSGSKKDAASGTKDSGSSGPSTGRDASGGGDAQVSARTDGGTRDSGAARDTGAAPPVSSGEACTPAPTGTFETMSEPGGPDGTYTIHRPVNLGEGGFKHPPIAWGNGVITTPDFFVEQLSNIASHGFVVIADPGVTVTAAIVRQGLEWLIEQNNGSGELAGHLAVDCAGAIGYSMGGGSAIGAGSHPAVRAVVSIHGLPDQAARVNGPLLLTTSDGDTFVTKSGFVMPNYTGSATHPTIMATHSPQGNSAVFGDHLEPLGAGGLDAEPTLAWLRYWIYGDESQRDWFYGASCKLCSDPWTDIQRKNHEWD